MTRAQITALSDLELAVQMDRLRDSLRRAWQRGEPGNLVDVYDMGLTATEASIRGVLLRPYSDPNQLSLFLQS